MTTYVAVTTERRPEGEYRHCCYRTTDGRDRTLLGCRHLQPASAVAHSRALAAKATDVSPANGSTTPGDPPAAVGFDPFAGAPSKAASPGSRNAGQ